MSAKPEATEDKKPAGKGKKLFLMIGIGVVVLALAAGGGWFYLSKKNAAHDEDTEVVTAKPKGPPTFLPLDNMVVNLADPGGAKVAQIGITFELLDASATEKVKAYLPAIRSGILLQLSQRTSDEILQIDGKEKLAAAILAEASRPFVGDSHAETATTKEGTKEGEKESPKKKKASKKSDHDENPIRGVLFSSFIVQ